MRRTAASISRFGTHAEHLIVDWSSQVPISAADLPADPRVRLLRVEGETRWWLSRAYNRGFREAAHPWILKADADAVLEEPFFSSFDPAAATLQLRHLPGGLASQGRLDDLGLFAVEAEALRRVGGFNPWLVGWGFDDIDLIERLFLLPGTGLAHLSAEGIESLSHGVAMRLGGPEQILEAVEPWRRWHHTWKLQAQLEANRTLAALARSGSLPNLPEAMGQEPADLLRRLPAPVIRQRQRALLAGWLRPLIGRHGHAVAGGLPPACLSWLVAVLALDGHT